MRGPLALLVANLVLVAGQHEPPERLQVPELRFDPAAPPRVLNLDPSCSGGSRVVIAKLDGMPILVPDAKFADAQPWPRGMVIAPPAAFADAQAWPRGMVVTPPVDPGAPLPAFFAPFASGLSGLSGVSGVASGIRP